MYVPKANLVLVQLIHEQGQTIPSHLTALLVKVKMKVPAHTHTHTHTHTAKGGAWRVLKVLPVSIYSTLHVGRLSHLQWRLSPPPPPPPTTHRYNWIFSTNTPHKAIVVCGYLSRKGLPNLLLFSLLINLEQQPNSSPYLSST